MKIKEVIVVEGKSDTVAVTSAVQADTIETNGSALNAKTIEIIRHAQMKRGVIIFTDPDIPGEQIRKKVSQAVSGCKHAFLTKAETIGKKNESLGIEHASKAAIREALSKVYTEYDQPETSITRQDLIEYGLMAGTKAKNRRERLGERLNIGYTNGKQLLKRLGRFHISREEFIEAAKKVVQEEVKS